ncbi:MAG: hypothetical protein M3R44_08340 [Candidatus Eremiobacteraeota bacterium]|nr:hypothetical protein [Candidatus Eremiobacteraeota bacterium]
MSKAGERRIADFTTVRAGYAVRSAYLTNVPANIEDGTLVAGEQSLGLPLQKAIVSIRAEPPRGLGYNAALVYEGLYNELNQPPFAVVNAGLSYRRRKPEFSLDATNLTNVYGQRFTRQGAGLPYGGAAGPIATDSYALQGTALSFLVMRRF